MPIGYNVGAAVNHFWRSMETSRSWRFDPSTWILERLFFLLTSPALHICIRFVNAIYDSRASLSRARCGWKYFLTFSRSCQSCRHDWHQFASSRMSLGGKQLKMSTRFCRFYVLFCRRSRDNFPLSWFLSRQIWWPHSRSLIRTAL